jgi:hypothetical protein
MRKQIIEIFEKKIEDRTLKTGNICPTTVKNWKKKNTRMYIDKVEKAMEENEIPEPFFWNGTYDGLLEINAECAKKLGKNSLKIEITINQ